MNKLFFFIVITLGFNFQLVAKQLNDETAPLNEIESELKTVAFQILNHDSVDYKFELNRKFTSRMMTILKRTDSYDYNFDSFFLRSIYFKISH